MWVKKKKKLPGRKPALLTQPCTAGIGAVSKKVRIHAGSFRFLPDRAPFGCGLFTPRCLRPPPLADNHKAGLSALTLFSFSPATTLARKELSQLSSCGHPNSEVESKVLQELCCAAAVFGFPQA